MSRPLTLVGILLVHPVPTHSDNNSKRLRLEVRSHPNLNTGRVSKQGIPKMQCANPLNQQQGVYPTCGDFNQAQIGPPSIARIASAFPRRPPPATPRAAARSTAPGRPGHAQNGPSRKAVLSYSFLPGLIGIYTDCVGSVPSGFLGFVGRPF